MKCHGTNAFNSLCLPESEVLKYWWVLSDIVTLWALLPGAPEEQLKLIFSLLNDNRDFQYMIQIMLLYYDILMNILKFQSKSNSNLFRGFIQVGMRLRRHNCICGKGKECMYGGTWIHSIQLEEQFAETCISQIHLITFSPSYSACHI